MSPEQAKGNPADARTDVYAAGCVLFEVVSGRRPFVENTPEAVVMAHLTAPIPSLAKVRPGLGAAAPLLQPVVEKAMAKKPSARFKDASAMLAALETVIDKLPAEGAGERRSESRRKTTGRARAVSTAGSRFRRWVVTLILLGAGVAVAATYLRTVLRKYLHREQASEESPTPPVKQPRKRAPVVEAPPKPAAKPEPPAPAPTKAQATPATEDRARPEEKEPPPQPQPQSERSSRPHAHNPWRAPVPRELRSIRNQLDRGAHPSQKTLQPLYDYAHANPGDARPWLLLGHAYAENDWFSDAVDRYVRADRVDSTSRGDPQMLADLLKAAAHPAASHAAARAIRDIYGAEAIPAVEKALKNSAGDRQASARLARLRESLPR